MLSKSRSLVNWNVIGAPSTLPLKKIPGTKNHSFLHKEKVDFLWNKILLFFLEFCGIYLNKFFLELRMLLMDFFTGKVLGVSITFQVTRTENLHTGRPRF